VRAGFPKLCALFLMVLLAACARLDHLGKPPTMSNIDQSPAAMPEAQVVSLPMPQPPPHSPRIGADKASLWSGGSGSLFIDQRAREVGDIITVVINIRDRARMQNETIRTRDTSENMGMPRLLGLESLLGDIMPGSNDDTQTLADFGSRSTTRGNGEINRDENIQLKVAAVVTDRLPNGNMVIAGRQEVRVNFELRELRVAGVIRPEDIDPDNTVDYDKIAEARIAYGGRGQITDVQQPRYGQQIYDIIIPF